MKTFYIILLSVFLLGCATATKAPTPFTTNNEVIVLQGCKDLQEEVKEKNKTLPADEQLEADC